MEKPAAYCDPLSELETRQDEVLRRLDELGRQVEAALAQWLSDNAAAEG